MYSYATRKKTVSHASGQNRALTERAENSALGSYLSGLKGSKLNMSDELQQKIRERCGISPEGIKVYRDSGLAELGQKAYARGNEIHLASNAGSLDSEDGHKTILHEAAHIVQQGKSHSLTAGINETPSLESEAHAVAEGGHMDATGFTAPMPAQAAPIQGLGKWDKAKKWLSEGRTAIGGKINELADKAKGALAPAGKFVADKAKSAAGKAKTALAPVGNFIADKAVGAYDWVRNKLDDRAERKKREKEAKGPKEPGFFSKLGTRISDAYQGSKLQSAVDTARGGLKTAGSWVAGKAKAAGSAVASAAKTAGSGIANGVKSIGNFIKAHRKPKDPNAEPGFFSRMGTKISNAYQGSLLQKSVKATGAGLKAAGSWVADKGKSAYNWAMNKKQDLTDWVQDKKDSFAEHEKNRYMMNKANRENEEGGNYAERIQAARLALNNGAIGERIKNRQNLQQVLDYQSERPETGIMDTVKGVLANKHQMSSLAVSGALSGGGMIAKKMVPDTFGDVVSGSTNFLKGAYNAGLHKYQQNQVNAVTEDQLKQGATDEQLRFLKLAQGNMSDKLDRDQFGDKIDMIKGAATAGGGALNMVVPGAGAVGSLVSNGATVVNKIVQGKMESSGNWRSIKDEIFGSQDDYKAFKKAHGLRKKDMQLLLAEQAGYRDIDEMADSSKWQQAQVMDTLVGKEGDNGAKDLLAAKGIKGNALKTRDVESIANNDLGASLSLTTLQHNRDRRLKKRGGK